MKNAKSSAGLLADSSKASTDKMPAKRQKIGLIGLGNGVGDALFALKAMYGLKHFYGAEVVYFSNKISKQMFRNCDFIDECVDLGDISGGFLRDFATAQMIAQEKCDVVILGELKSKSVRLLKQAKIKRIICAMKIFSLFSWRCRTLPIYARSKYKNLSKEAILIAFARKADRGGGYNRARRAFDEGVRNLTWRDISLKLDKSNVAFAKGFWDKVVASVESSQKFGVDSGAKAGAQGRIYTILVNPFNISNPYSISQKGFLQLIEKIASMPQFVVIVPTYKAVHDAFMRDFEKYFGVKPKGAESSFNDFGADSAKVDSIKLDSALDSSNSGADCDLDSANLDSRALSRTNASQSALENIYIFQNTDDLLNLAALMRHISLCISPSTGTIHIASNQGARTLGLFSRSDSMRWATDDKRYIILEKPLKELSHNEEQKIIAQTLQELESMRAQGAIEPKL
ncbi:hypothetical protein BKN38_09145 [Helicobacter sp. CLO-3]|uniref:glycosyltransferase family 9 protein n=1 Tax=unclassified Helicobacter TaxID=2593540 RepID=UPI000805AC05|nr:MULTISPECIES: glycosyltransferase family 9 protein [unclassified Helicobacter]OBV28735.1 hypothetical protein BA723_08235 [Helicobacter sp. CLO-3]OHU81387.1 hypothetical protein BKN38_09145 [Helicobacter sp. CLO-3]